MRYLRIIFLHFESVFEHRLRSLVWFFDAMINPLVILLFWAGARVSNSQINKQWSTQNINSYYLLLIVAAALLVSHIEEDIAYFDIRQGDLARYLTKPFSYYWLKFIEEIPYRVLQGTYGVVALFIISLFFKNLIQVVLTPQTVLVGLLCATLAFFICYTYKMCLGLSAFWLTEIRGITQFLEITAIIFGGFIMPLEMFPASLKSIAYFLPFPYMIYFPIKIFQVGLANVNLTWIITGQLSWLFIFVVINRLLWYRGMKNFTAVGR